MKMLFRLFWLIFSQTRRSRCHVLQHCESDFRVWPNDLDVFMHVNNGVYLTYADLGRTDLMLRADVFHLIRERGWYPVVAGESIQFRKSLKLWQRFSITTRILGWTERAIYMEQVFRRKDEHVATALIDARFLARAGGKVAVTELMELVGLNQHSPELPPHVKLWVSSMAGDPLYDR